MVLFVGDKPSRLNTDPNIAFKGARCEKRLNEWISILSVTSIVINSTDDDFYLMINLFLTAGAPIVALGNVASKKLKKAPHFKLPHPSGLNRQINDKLFINNKLQECKKFLSEYKVCRQSADK